MPRHPFTLELTDRQAEALRSLAAAEDLPPEVYAAEVLVKHLYHAFSGPASPRTGRPSTPNEPPSP